MYASLGTLQTTFLTVGAVGILASVLGGWLLARAALRPIDWLAATAHAIGAAQDFGRRVPTRPGRRRDEVGRLADELNGMLARLQAARDQIEAALGAQRRFIADASHELRTPLTSIRGNIDLLQTLVAEGRSADDVDEQERILAEAAAEIERLGRLVNDLLLLAQADAGQHIALAATRLDTVVHEAFRSARFLREGVALQIEPVPSDVWVEGHADRLKQLFLILLDNGLKYTPRGGRVTIGGEEQSRAGASGLAIRVADTGPGIPPGEREKIFDRFYRADPARTAGGAGLGLAIARWIVEEHGGAIEVESTPDAGSVFTVWLPTMSAPIESTAPAVAAEQRLDFSPAATGSSPTAVGEAR
jgi:signal transduction histidine kinase